MMAHIQIHAGDFTSGKGAISIKANIFTVIVAWAPGDGFFGKAYTFFKQDIEELIQATEENMKRFGEVVDWRGAGVTLFGPVSLLTGLLYGGKGKDVTFILKLKDGRKMLASTDSKTFTKLETLAC